MQNSITKNGDGPLLLAPREGDKIQDSGCRIQDTEGRGLGAWDQEEVKNEKCVEL